MTPTGDEGLQGSAVPVHKIEAHGVRPQIQEKAMRMHASYFGTGAIALALLLTAATAGAQQMYIYPQKGQSQEQQNKDKYECSQWATGQTGFDPTQAANTYQADPNAGRGSTVKGAAGGAVTGAVIGAIAGDAGKGAAIGAAGGGILGAGRRGSAQAAEQKKQQQSQAAYRAGLENYNRAMSTCLQGRGYSVS